MGGTKKENVVICLESPRIKSAVADYIRANIPKFHSNPELLYNIMAYELMYICYCDRSRQMFHQWLEKKHGGIGGANRKWGTTYRSFDEVAPPPVKNSRPLAGTNRALWYDWARFNQDASPTISCGFATRSGRSIQRCRWPRAAAPACWPVAPAPPASTRTHRQRSGRCDHS